MSAPRKASFGRQVPNESTAAHRSDHGAPASIIVGGAVAAAARASVSIRASTLHRSMLEIYIGRFEKEAEEASDGSDI